MNEKQFISELKNRGIELNTTQVEQFNVYFHTLVEWNKKMNLTSLVSLEDVYLKHFFDSISASFYFDLTKILNVCDVGAGAGFPSIPLKICFPQLHISIVDSLKKRIGFLDHLKEVLNLENVKFYHDRAETFGQNAQFREQYDVVLARAVAKMSVLSELCLPLVKVSGEFIAMKGAQTAQEIREAKKAIQTLGGEVGHIHTFHMPYEKSERSIVIIKKQKKTPNKYPRNPGTPNRKPII